MVHVLFFDNVEGIYIDWDSLPDNISNKLFNKLKLFMKEDFGSTEKGEKWEPYTSWKLIGHGLYPQSGRYDVKVVITELKLIIKFMNDNKIPWIGEKIVFIEFSNDDYPGFIVFKNDMAILSYIINEDKFDTEYIPLIDTIKLI